MTFRITNLANVMDAATNMPWAILPDKLDAIAEVLSVRVSDAPLSADDIAARVGDGAPKSNGRMAGSVAVIPLNGTLMPRANIMTQMSGGTSVQQFIEQVRAAMHNPDVSAVVLDVDSPGGAVTGIPEAADALRAMRGLKPMVAVANHLMASGAYWLAAQADEIVASPSANVGSVGVYQVHRDVSRAMENEGVRHTLIRAGKYKADGASFEPLSTSAREEMQARVDEAYDQFVNALAAGRGVTAATVRAQYGEGRVLSAAKAMASGMVDRVATLDDVLNELTAGAPTPRSTKTGRRAEADAPAMSAGLEAALTTVTTIAASIGADPLMTSDPCAGTADVELNPGTDAALQAEETPVSLNATTAPTGATQQDDRAARLAELVELRPEAASKLAGWITSGTTYEQAKAELNAGMPAPTPTISVGAQRETQRPWESLGHFAAAVAMAGMPAGRAHVDPRLFATATGINQSTPSDGGFLVPGQFSNELWMGLFDDPTSLLSLCDTYDVEGEFLEMPAIDEPTRANGTVYGGVSARWLNEADQIAGSKPKFRKMRLEPQELAAMVYVTEKMLNNSPVALGQYVDRMGRGAIQAEVDAAIVAGDGAGKPKGILSSGCKIVVNKEGSQANGTIMQENISKMWARLPSSVRNRAVWLHNVDVEPALDTLSTVVKNVAGTDNVGGYANKVFDAERRTLKGRPLLANDNCNTLGAEGDLILLDPLSYAVGLRRAGVKTAQSMHLRFEYAEMAFRFMFDVDGQSWLNTPITPKKGATRSPIVTLQAR